MVQPTWGKLFKVRLKTGDTYTKESFTRTKKETMFDKNQHSVISAKAGIHLKQ
jgi:hypothetical protein